jgi:hypothetical protein
MFFANCLRGHSCTLPLRSDNATIMRAKEKCVVRPPPSARHAAPSTAFTRLSWQLHHANAARHPLATSSCDRRRAQAKARALHPVRRNIQTRPSNNLRQKPRPGLAKAMPKAIGITKHSKTNRATLIRNRALDQPRLCPRRSESQDVRR